ncbi:MAG: hypothetical protein K1X78_05270 [Verrucomicrobiaceae bacterium]|nr:hypothetical protein [Verrucomicrobiaceae bacterium]
MSQFTETQVARFGKWARWLCHWLFFAGAAIQFLLALTDKTDETRFWSDVIFGFVLMGVSVFCWINIHRLKKAASLGEEKNPTGGGDS